MNRDRYDGEWQDGMRSGRGSHYFANGDKYDGEWRINLCHGEGTYTTTAGHYYCGSWKSGKVIYMKIFSMNYNILNSFDYYFRCMDMDYL